MFVLSQTQSLGKSGVTSLPPALLSLLQALQGGGAALGLQEGFPAREMPPLPPGTEPREAEKCGKPRKATSGAESWNEGTV